MMRQKQLRNWECSVKEEMPNEARERRIEKCGGEVQQRDAQDEPLYASLPPEFDAAPRPIGNQLPHISAGNKQVRGGAQSVSRDF
jgi:hypothetical protein